MSVRMRISADRISIVPRVLPPFERRLTLRQCRAQRRIWADAALALVGNDTFTSGKASQNGTSDSLRWHSVTAGADYSSSKRTDVYRASIGPAFTGMQRALTSARSERATSAH
ncbi:hypothetical protein [Burkholderia vietnamiensis]|uniref:hypothetical protein n=1 Tax=Burkholderia vietnamiensis TaxID=60552 RepID=UPI0012D41AD9|nr:hypothetical protein [Burkholderia vietnamiensis]HDR9178076.1 hypothetical protein [Burkholderia vietnamiensis]